MAIANFGRCAIALGITPDAIADCHQKEKPLMQPEPSRLDRIEATLERVSQQLDNQVVVNAELRQSVGELTELVNSLIGIANQHQENFMVLVTEIRDIRTDMREMQFEMQQILSLVERLEN